MDHVWADGNGGLWLVEVLSRSMARDPGSTEKCVNKALHSLFMLGAAWTGTDWSRPLLEPGMAFQTGHLRLAFVIDVAAEKDLATLSIQKADLFNRLRGFAAIYDITSRDVLVLHMAKAQSLGLPTAG